MEALFQRLLQDLRQAVQASEQNCREVAGRLSQEAVRICTESQRIQASGEVESWALNLGQHRLTQCLRYYRLGSKRGRLELHSTLSAIVYRYITPPQVQSSYQARLLLIEDFLQNFYAESMNAFRRECAVAADYQPRTALELAEYMAFAERYGKRRIPLPGRRSQQLIILRAQTFAKQQPPETAVDIEQAAEVGSSDEVEQSWQAALMKRLREQIGSQSEETGDSLRYRVVEELIAYLREKDQTACADYFTLRLMDLPTHEIEAILGLSARERDYLQQRFKYHLLKFAFSYHWELVHEWLGADLDNSLGLTTQQWNDLQEKLTGKQSKLLQLKHQGESNTAILEALDLSPTQLKKQWSKLLEQAWEIRNL
ncbi:heterocyst differentiation protein HetZ [Romeria aff. gracilis LEGE 07310]|uniref:Heterocyst differentiation protein HetZ n=1 Tax=Vasconcelosia minhoensis LEGE 07310 TaxID=915328 RepID=A0A8J7AW15_9CYAN|nr:heterocyst differentiation protein HetZ [Romeria gracilis]MBE9080124.1 heterocyst differentiation protein HetZ [Romeria aff. gracilis LEGE 07310]